MADIARFTGQPYGTVLLHRAAGHPARHGPRARPAIGGEQAAEHAVAVGACAADLSSLHLLGLLDDDDDRLRIRAALPSLSIARAAVDDTVLTRDHMRGTSVATYTASLAADGTIERTTLTATEQALLRGQGETSEVTATSLDVLYPMRLAMLRPRQKAARPA